VNSLQIKDIPGGVEFAVLATPGSSRSCVRGIHGNALKVAVRAPPEKGKANDEIEEVLAEFLGVSTKSVQVVAGMTSRQKRVQAMGVNSEHVFRKLQD